MSERRKIVVPKKYIDKYGEIKNLYSYSKVSSIDGCPYEYYLSRILKKEGKNNSYAVLGGYIHDIIEKFYNNELTYDGMLDEFETKWLEIETSGNIKLYNDEEKNTKMVEQYKEDIVSFLKTHKPLGKVLTEKEVWKDINGNIFFGYADGITKDKDGNTVIIDWKTSTLYKGDDIKAHQQQLLLYSLALNELGIPLDKIKACWLFLKYFKIKFNHMISVTFIEKGKEKTSTCLKSLWVSKVKTQLKKDIVTHYEKQDKTFTNKELKAMIDKCVEDNNLDPLPKEIRDMYVLNDVIKIVRRHKYVKEIASQIKKDLKLAEVNDIEMEILLVECMEGNTLEPIKDLINLDNYEFGDAYVYIDINDDTINELKESLCRNIDIINSRGKKEENWQRTKPIEEREGFYCSVLCSQRNNCKYYKEYKEVEKMYTVTLGEDADNDDLLNNLLNM